jgi:hypothetical protein
MKRTADARKRREVFGKKTRADVRKGKWFRGNFQIFMENLQNYTATRSETKLPKQNGRNVPKMEQINSGNKEEILMTDETFVGGGSSIQVQPVELRRQARELHKKPRGGSRGAVTRSLSGR